jgi:hypothetical protein
MSHYAMGWAQRQKLGDPIAKAVLQFMCYVLRDELLLVWVGIPTLEEFTEYEERALRAAIARMVKAGVLLDTGKKKNNVTVYRIPGYEQWLAALQAGTPVNGGASPTDRDALAQVAELAKEKTVSQGGNNKPPRKGEGPELSPPVDAAKPSRLGGQALPSTGPNLPSDLPLPSGADGRAIPTGSPVLDAKGNPFDERASRAYWWNRACGYAVSSASLFELCARGTNTITDIPEPAQAALLAASRDATSSAVEASRALFPNAKRDDLDDIETTLRRRIDREITSLRASRVAA